MIDQRLKKEIQKIISLKPVTLISNGKDGVHCITVDRIKFLDENRIIIKDTYMRKTLKNIKENNNVSLNIWGAEKDKDHEYEVCGKARHFKSGKLFEKIKKECEEEGMPCKGIIVFTIEKIERI
ncbi:MAG: hypothetical protein GF347_05480 [Candidatus Moranbacteria bacterium]|nr:hypothetical protein [Candidatus Moranbacteria bacterium]